MAEERVADLVARWVADELGQRHVYMVTGAGIMHLTDGVARNSRLTGICLHHEQSVSMATEAFSRVDQSPGVAYVSTGPGATNAVTGVAGAWQDSVACVFIAGQVKVSEASSQLGGSRLRQFGVQELDTIPIFKSITKYCTIVSDPKKILFELGKALHLATSGRPGPVWLEIPMDVQSARVRSEKLQRFIPDQPESLSKENAKLKEDIQRLGEALAKSKRPVFVVGQGLRISGEISNFRRFIDERKIPIVSTYLGVDSTQPHTVNYIGKIGVKGERAANITVQKADLLVALGTSLHVSAIGYDYDEFAPGAEKWIVDIDSTAHKKPTLGGINILETNLRGFFFDLDTQLSASEPVKRNWQAWNSVAQSLRTDFPTISDEYEEDSQGINIYKVVDMVCAAANSSDVFVSDAGSAFYAVSQAVRLSTDAQRYVTSGAMATMGYSVPAAIGVSLARPSSRVWAFTGDGSLFQNVQELGQIGHLGLNVSVVVLNNDGYLSIRNSQENYFNERYIGTDEQSGLGLPDIVAISQAFGVRSTRINTIDELNQFLTSNQSSGPVLLDVRCPPSQRISPSVSSKILQDGSMVSKPIHDMDPELDRGLLEEIMKPDWGFPPRKPA